MKIFPPCFVSVKQLLQYIIDASAGYNLQINYLMQRTRNYVTIVATPCAFDDKLKGCRYLNLSV